MFARSMVTMFISLYASRLLLQKLGIDDYGTYYVVGGIVTMFNVLRTFFSSSIQRFLNFTKGLGDKEKQNRIFNVGLEIQLALCIVFLLVLETFGIIAVNHLNIDTEKIFAVHVIFQLSIATAIVSMLTVPYDALIIANEKMGAFAGFAVTESLLRLIIIFFISIGPFDTLINYAVLAFIVAVIMRILNASYCSHLFPESKIHFTYDKKLFKEMGQFAGWNFLGNTGFSLCHEGINYILNQFGGVAINSARALAYQILNALNSLIGNVDIAFKPQVNASAAYDDRSTFFELLVYNAKITSTLYMLIMVPTVILVKPAIYLWLGNIPGHVVPFIICVSLYHLVRTVHLPIDLYFSSIGKLKYYQVIDLCYLSLNLPAAWLLLHFNYPYWTVFLSMTIIEIFSHLSVALLGAFKYDYPLKKFSRSLYRPFLTMTLVCISIVYVNNYIGIDETTSIAIVILIGLLNEIVLVLFMSFIMLNTYERKKVIEAINSKLIQIKK